MPHTLSRFSFILLLGFFLTACASWNSVDSTKQAVCTKLKNDIIFYGTTGNTRNAEIQGAQLPLAQHDYDKHCG